MKFDRAIAGIVVSLLAGCNHVEPMAASDPVACIAAFENVLETSKGLGLDNDPHRLELKTRIKFEQEKIAGGSDPAANLKLLEFADRLRGDDDTAGRLAIDCVMAEERTPHYGVRRKHLQVHTRPA